MKSFYLDSLEQEYPVKSTANPYLFMINPTSNSNYFMKVASNYAILSNSKLIADLDNQNYAYYTSRIDY